MNLTHAQETRPSQRKGPYDLIPALAFPTTIPPLNKFLHIPDPPLDTRSPEIFPQPPRRYPQYGVQPGAPARRLESAYETLVNRTDQNTEILLRNPRFKDRGVDIAEGRCKIPGDHPVAVNADNARGIVEGWG